MSVAVVKKYSKNICLCTLLCGCSQSVLDNADKASVSGLSAKDIHIFKSRAVRDDQVAIVCNEVISRIDVESQIKMMIMGSAPLDDALHKKMFDIVLNMLIDKATKFAIASSFLRVDDFAKEIDQMTMERYKEYARSIGYSHDEFNIFLEQNGIAPHTIKRFLKWDCVWNIYTDYIVNMRNVNVDDNFEISHRASIMMNPEEKKFLISRIVLHDKKHAQEKAKEIVNLLQSGCHFTVVSSVYSPKSVDEDSILLVSSCDISREEYKALCAMQEDSLQVVNIPDGVSILYLHKKVKTPDFSSVEYFTFTYKSDNEINDEHMNYVAGIVKDIENQSSSLDEFYHKISTDSRFICANKMQSKVSDLLGIDQKMAMQIRDKGVSQPNYSSDGVVFMCVLDRKTHPDAHKILEKDIKNRIKHQKIEKISHMQLKKYKNTVPIVRFTK